MRWVGVEFGWWSSCNTRWSPVSLFVVRLRHLVAPETTDTERGEMRAESFVDDDNLLVMGDRGQVVCVWCGVMWCGVEWCGIIWHRIRWYDVM